MAMGKRRIVAGVGYELRASNFEQGERWKFALVFGLLVFLTVPRRSKMRFTKD
jgi:hypothetical protein